MTAFLVANVLASTLYLPMASSLIPSLIERAEQNDFQGLLALATLGAQGDPNMSVGMQLSVICAEDAPKITPEDRAKEADGSIGGPYVCACAGSVRVLAARHGGRRVLRAVKSEVPTAGPCPASSSVTTPICGETINQTPHKAKHVRHPGHRAHRRWHGMRDAHYSQLHHKGNDWGLDTSCIANIKRPPFFVTARRPDPGRPASPMASAGQLAMIRVENLHKRFGDVRAVDGGRSSPPTSSVTACSDPTAPAKPTTLRMLYTLMRSDEARSCRTMSMRRPIRKARAAASGCCQISRGCIRA